MNLFNKHIRAQKTLYSPFTRNKTEGLLPSCQVQAGFCLFLLQKQAEAAKRARNCESSFLFSLHPGARNQAGARKTPKQEVSVEQTGSSEPAE